MSERLVVLDWVSGTEDADNFEGGGYRLVMSREAWLRAGTPASLSITVEPSVETLKERTSAVASEDEMSDANAQATALDVPCTTCWVLPGQPCKDRDGRALKGIVHDSRGRRARMENW